MFNNFLKCFLVFLPSMLWAEPSTTPRLLMNEPMSIFDWGIYKADTQVKSSGKYKQYTLFFMGASAQYDWDQNRIVLTTLLQGGGVKEICKNNLEIFKGMFASFTWDKTQQKEKAKQVLNNLFSHEAGYQSNNQPKDTGEQLIKILRFEVVLMNEDGSGGKGSLKCTGTYNSPEIKIIEY